MFGKKKQRGIPDQDPADKRPRISIVNKIGTPLSIIAMLLVIISALTVSEFFRFRSSLAELSEQTLPQITLAARLSTLLNQLLYQTERLSGASSQPARRLAWQEIQKQFIVINRFTQDITYHSQSSSPTQQIKLLEQNLSELNDLLERKLAIERDADIALKELLSIEKNLFITTQVVTRATNANETQIINEWFEKALNTTQLAYDAILLKSLYKAKSQQRIIDQRFEDLSTMIKDLSTPTGVMIEQLQSELEKYISGTNGLMTLTLERIQTTSQTIGRSNFVSSLVEEVGFSGASVLLELNVQAEQNIATIAERINGQARLFAGLSLVALILTIIIFIYFRLALIGRLIELNDTVLAKVAGRRAEIDTTGNDEISDIARSVNYFTSELSKAKDTAEEASHAKSNFLAHMSHEIRTPLNAIIGFCTLAMKTEPSGETNSYLRKINYSSQSLLAIINDILDFSKIEAGALTVESIPFSLEDQLIRLSTMFSFRCEEKNLKFSLDIASQIPDRVLGDPLRLGQVLTNLLNNAVKFTHQGQVSLNAKLDNGERQEKIYVAFHIVDTGIGMNDDQVDALFTPFVQADDSITRKYGGTGLGMTITKLLIDKLDGKIAVSSRKTLGTTITVTIPFSHAQPENSQALTPELVGSKVLIIDRVTERVTQLCSMAEAIGFITATSQTIDEAFAKLEQSVAVEEPDIEFILIDAALFYADRATLAGKLAARCVIILNHDNFPIAEFDSDNFEIAKLVRPPETKHELLQIMINISQKKQDLKSLYGIHENRDLKGLQGKQVLLVEDNYINQQVAQKVLENEQINVTLANNGEEALELLTASSAVPFDLILMDLQMPVMDGYTATERIRALEKPVADIPIVAMTAHALVEDYQKCIETGMDGYLSKPINLEELFSTLTALILNTPKEKGTS